MPEQPPNNAYQIPVSHIIRLGDLNARGTKAVSVTPDSAARAAVADALGITAVKKLTFSGALIPEGKSDWRLQADLGATVVQPCVVTLDPVTTRIDEPVVRRYLASLNAAPDPDTDPDDGEFEMPEDDTLEPLLATIDLGAVMLEALALALPQWPRAKGVESGPVQHTEPGRTPMTDEDARPFANLRAQLDAKGDDDG